MDPMLKKSSCHDQKNRGSCLSTRRIKFYDLYMSNGFRSLCEFHKEIGSRVSAAYEADQRSSKSICSSFSAVWSENPSLRSLARVEVRGAGVDPEAYSGFAGA